MFSSPFAWALEHVPPSRHNFLLNPEHPDFKRIRIDSPIDYDFDPRLLSRLMRYEAVID
jgi:hypothetical protein